MNFVYIGGMNRKVKDINRFVSQNLGFEITSAPINSLFLSANNIVVDHAKFTNFNNRLILYGTFFHENEKYLFIDGVYYKINWMQ